MDITTLIFIILSLAAGLVGGILVNERKNARLKDAKADVERKLSGKMVETEMLNRQIKELQERHSREMIDAENRHERDSEIKLEKLKQQITALTAEMLKTRSSELSVDNRQQIGEIVTPLRILIDDVKKSVESSRASYDRNTAALEEQLKLMCETTLGVGAKADRLSEALQSGPKVQGNFGEMKLEVMLSDFGFTKGVEYDAQETMKDENGVVIKNEDTGRRMIPDFVLHYPDNRDVILDSKVSLTAFVDYMNAEDDEARKTALQSHLKSITKHVEELSDKEYYKYIPKSKSYLDYVIMFVPNESALVLALSADPMLWRKAFEHKVFITGEQNLFAVLQLLKIMWTQKLQAENHEQVYSIANELMGRIGLFLRRFKIYGDKIEELQKAYDKIRISVSGNKGIKVSARQLIEMGAKEDPKYRIGEIDDEPCDDEDKEDPEDEK